MREDGTPDWLDPYAVPRDVYDGVNVPDRGTYFHVSPEAHPDHFREAMEEFGLPATKTLARASRLPGEPLGRLMAPEHSERLSLVACRRPADAALILDFGVANGVATPGIFAGVLRSWEERFGIVPVMLRPSWTSFQVTAPPTDDAEIDLLAAEVFCLATDSGLQEGFYLNHGYQSPVNAQQLVRSRQWHIWWD